MKKFITSSGKFLLVGGKWAIDYNEDRGVTGTTFNLKSADIISGTMVSFRAGETSVTDHLIEFSD